MRMNLTAGQRRQGMVVEGINEINRVLEESLLALPKSAVISMQ